MDFKKIALSFILSLSKGYSFSCLDTVSRLERYNSYGHFIPKVELSGKFKKDKFYLGIEFIWPLGEKKIPYRMLSNRCFYDTNQNP